MKLSKILFEDSSMSHDVISEKIRSLKLYGFGGFCGDAAIQINKKVFNNEGQYVVAANKFLWENINELLDMLQLNIMELIGMQMQNQKNKKI